MENKGGENTPYDVVVLPYPSQGHINPMLQFSKLLASQGLKVTLLTTTFIAKSLPTAVGQVRVGQISDGFDDGGYADAGTVETYLESLKAVGSRGLSYLLERQRQSTCCLVYDAFLPWALEVAKRLGIVGAAFFTQTCSVNSFYYHKYHGKLASLVAGETVSLPGLPPLGIPDLPSFLSVAGSYPGYLSLVVNQFSNLQMADWVLFNTFDKLEAEVVSWMAGLWPMKTVGPTLPSAYLGNPLKGDNDYGLAVCKPAGGACIRWLDACPTGSVAYVSFGSMATLEPEQMEELARGLQEANTHFLWVVREPEKEKLPNGFSHETKTKGLIISWSPQLEVLAHPAVGCFMTHCGWNSVLEGICLGVPLVGVPQWTDQPTNAKYVEDIWRVGLRAKVDEKGIVRREEVKRCVLEVVEGEEGKEMKRNASKWKELAKEAVDEGGSSNKNIKDFVRSICNK